MKKTMMVVALMVMVMNGVAMGSVVYKVGDSAGWTNVANVDYKAWASSKQFHAGDVIVFEYNTEFHDVARVDHKTFQTCDIDAAPHATYTTGNDSITLKANTHYYYICTVPGHCQNGQKVDIHVIPDSMNLAPHYGPGPVEPLPFPFPPPPPAASSPPSISPVPSSSPAVPPSQPPSTPPQAPSPPISVAPVPSSVPVAPVPSPVHVAPVPSSVPVAPVPSPVHVAPVPSSVPDVPSLTPDVPEPDAPAPSPQKSGAKDVFAGKLWVTVVVLAACVYGGMA